LRKLLDRRTFTLTDSELERRFLPMVRAVGLPKPQSRVYVNGFRVDFYWPQLHRRRPRRRPHPAALHPGAGRPRPRPYQGDARRRR
jgi:hypothetical protein